MAVDPTAIAEVITRLAEQLQRDAVLPADRIYTPTEIGDPVFYAANRNEIHAAIRTGRVQAEEQQ